MKPEDAEEYTQALGQVVAGGWRQIALGERLGVPAALKLTTEQWVKQRLGGYVRLSLDERKAAAIELKAEGLTQDRIGAVLGVDQKTISNDLAGQENSSRKTRISKRKGHAVQEDSSAAEQFDVMSTLAATNDVRQRIEGLAARDERRTDRMVQLAEVARGNLPLSMGARYPIVYADPPWRYEHIETESRAIENQYPTMALEDICALPIGDLVTPDCVLFLWATSPKLSEAMRVLEAWGFSYRTSMVWVKDQIGMGYYARQQHEFLLIGVRGTPPVPAPADRPASAIHAPRTKHSAKPGAFYEAIERMYPLLPKIELFARQAREGWAAWGNQAA